MDVREQIDLGGWKGKLDLPTDGQTYYLKITKKTAPGQVEAAYHHFKVLYDEKEAITLSHWKDQAFKLTAISYDPMLGVLRLRVVKIYGG